MVYILGYIVTIKITYGSFHETTIKSYVIELCTEKENGLKKL